MKVVETTSLIHPNDWLVLVNEKEKIAHFAKACKVDDVSHTGVCVQDGLGDSLSIDAKGGTLENKKDSNVQNVLFLKDIIRGNSPLYLLHGDDPIFSNKSLVCTLHIQDSSYKEPTKLVVPQDSFSPAGSNHLVQIDSFSRAEFNHLGECKTASSKTVQIVHVVMTWGVIVCHANNEQTLRPFYRLHRLTKTTERVLGIVFLSSVKRGISTPIALFNWPTRLGLS